ncbi:MAG: FAD-binding-2 domain-containing protein [Burkholderia sp.]|jgi:fumarate reductase flavoprotein subunit
MTLHKISRRAVLRTGAGLLAAGSLPASALENSVFDVIVAGSGAGGFAAAIRAAENGASVLLLEANDWLGGASRVSTGIFGCAGHPIQKALGFTTTPEDLYKLYIGTAAATHTKADPKTARILADGAIPAADWLESLGVTWSRKKARKFFLNIKEGHRLGELLIDSLEKRAQALKVDIRTRHRAVRLIAQDGRIRGIVCETPAGEKRFAAKAVVLATGGFENNPEMVAKYIGGGWEKAKVYCTPTDRGDGQRMAESAGAALDDMDVFKANPTVLTFKGNRINMIKAVRAGAFAVSQRGERFMNELGGYWQSRRLWALPEKSAWLIFGEPVLKADHRFPGLSKEGAFESATSLKELAAKIGVPGDALEKSAKAYLDAAAAGKDEAFGRPNPVNPFGGKYFAAKFEPMIQGTFGGVRADARTRVLSVSGKAIPGLYAVGECAANGLRGVNPQTANAVFGSIAGREAAAFAKEN